MFDSIAVIGDIHGHAVHLELLLKKIKEAHGDIPIFSVGDLIDRGPDSKGVIELCIKNNITACQGNHDDWVRKFISRGILDELAFTTMMGGAQTAVSYGVSINALKKGISKRDLAIQLSNSIPNSHKAYLSRATPYIFVPLNDGTLVWITHAGISNLVAAKDSHGKETDLEMMIDIASDPDIVDMILWDRPVFPRDSARKLLGTRDNLYKFDGKAVQVFGHTPVDEPVIEEHYVAIDTGFGIGGGALSAIILPSREVVQVYKDEI